MTKPICTLSDYFRFGASIIVFSGIDSIDEAMKSHSIQQYFHAILTSATNIRLIDGTAVRRSQLFSLRLSKQFHIYIQQHSIRIDLVL